MDRQLMSNLTYRPNDNNKIKLSFIYDYQFENILGSQFLRYTFDRTFSVTKAINTSRQYGLEWQHIFNASTFWDVKLKVLNIKTEERIELLNDERILWI